MKNAIIAMIMFIVMILTVVSINTVNTRTTRKNEIDDNISAAMEHSMKTLYEDKANGITMTKEELKDDFTKDFLSSVESDAEYKIEFKAADVEKGLLSVRITATYRQVFWDAHIVRDKTLVFDDYVNPNTVFYKITFKAPKYDATDYSVMDVRAEYSINKNGHIQELPDITFADVNKSIKGWKITEGPVSNKVYTETEIKELRVQQDITFSAVIE